ncbi:MAG: LPXTG cell wall anchor domain-containing protein [Nitrosarchaeum sp.]|nr:LPXTG cell wall anchor domain-containing protein [Nitrosarchaeum sp.]
MSYSVFGIAVFVIGLLIAVYGANMELKIVEDAMHPETSNTEYLQKILSSGYAFSIGLLIFGGILMIVGSVSIVKNRRSENHS